MKSDNPIGLLSEPEETRGNGVLGLIALTAMIEPRPSFHWDPTRGGWHLIYTSRTKGYPCRESIVSHAILPAGVTWSILDFSGNCGFCHLDVL